MHVCNPQATTIFGHKTYQCGCGKYFSKEQAEEQQSKYRQSIIKEFEDELGDE